MPEIKNAFSQGKMNKDLDERLIQTGLYKDALNVNVNAADGSGVGVVRNLLGNTRIDTIVGGVSYTCVGSIANERTNKLYWFVHGPGADAILEYDKAQDTNKIILYDHYGNADAIAENNPVYTPFYGENYDYSRILNFTGKQITGINIVDDFLFWSDGDDEPKKINISRSYHDGYTAFNQGANAPGGLYAFAPRLHVNGELTDTILHKDHITVIKKKPTSAPTVKLISAKGEAGSAIFEKVFLRFCTRYKYADGEYSAFGPFTSVIFNPEYDELVNSVNAYSTDEPYNKSMVNLIKSIELYDFITPDMPEDVVQVDILYKQEDSTAIYSIDNIKVGSSDANELGSGQFNTDASTSLYKGKYEITSENIHAVLPENQLLRPFDVVPKSALSQEIVGNRLVYGNYKQGYNFTDDTPVIDAYKLNRKIQDFTDGGLKSLKSQRKYQLGYVLGDKYGRETPVFTSRQAGVNIPWLDENGLNASKSTMLAARLFGDLPDWVDYYKFYVKSSSDEYYNLLMDKSYFPFTHNEFENPDDHIYVSFPSSDRNKIMEDDYIIAKKIYDSNNSQIPFENKYKILDISNEAPDAVKYVFFNLGSVDNTGDQLCTGEADFGPTSLFPGPSHSSGLKRIDQKTDLIHFHKTGWESNFGGMPLVDADDIYNKDVYISWNVGDTYSDRYKVTSVRLSGSTAGNPNVYILKLTSKISEKDAKLAAVNDTITDTEFKLDAGLVFTCERRETRGEEDFSGKFFVKIKHNDYLTGNDQNDTLYPVAAAKSFWLFGEHNTSDQSSFDGIINSESSAIASNLGGAVTVANSPNMNVDGLANTATEWNNIKTHIGKSFFIDDMNYVAGNASNEYYAKEAGKINLGAGGYYREFEWGPLFVTANEAFTVYNDALSGGSGELTLSGMDFEDINPDFAGENLYGWKAINNYHPYDVLPQEMSQKSWTQAVQSSYSAFMLPNRREDFINSFEGIVTQTGLGAGLRQFKDPTIYYGGSSFGGHSHVETYTPGKHYMHLSYLAPGVDLIEPLTADDLVGVSIKGRDSIASKLQGIWGGGAFNKVPDNPEAGFKIPSDSIADTIPFGELSAHEGNVVEFEGNYAESLQEFGGLPSTSSMPAPAGPGVGQGYDLSYKTKHEQQWNPAYSDSGPDPEIAAFVQRLKTPGQKFKFKGDASNTIYTILNVDERHIYNHTSWRLIWSWNDGEGSSYERPNNSVEEAASDWADFTDANGIPSNNSDLEGYSEAATTLATRINDFGAAHNRRTVFTIELDKNPVDHYDPRFDDNDIDATDFTDIEFISTLAPNLIDSLFSSPTVWETEPQQLTDLNIYYEASNNIPTTLTSKTNELFAPVGSEVKGFSTEQQEIYLSEWVSATKFRTHEPLLEGSYIATTIQFCRHDGSYVHGLVIGTEEVTDDNGNATSTIVEIEPKVRTHLPVGLNWFNCFSFGDGIESNRIRDGYNKMQISGGARVSATFEEPFIEEHRTNGLIYSGIYNPNSGVNNLNQFIAGEKITKDLNPTYGSIQKLFTRNTDLVSFCEDRVIKILANKDALFNADGQPQLVATNNVLGQAIPFQGDYGISQNPESFAADTYRAYFTDKQRGTVLRLSMDGLTPISDAGMREYFRDNLVDQALYLGSYDRFNQQYNLTIKKIPILENVLVDNFDEGVKSVESFNDTDFINDGTFTQGVDFSGVVQLEDLDLVERNKTLNPDLFVDVTIRNHPAIDVLVQGEEIMTDPVYDYISIDDVDEDDTDHPYWDFFYNDNTVFTADAFEDGSFTMYGWTSAQVFDVGAPGGAANANPFDGSNFGLSTTFNIHREVSYTWDPAMGANTFAYGGGYDGSDENLGFGAISDNTDMRKWSNRVFIFAQTLSGLDQVPDVLVDDGNDPWEAMNKGIVFRGSPWSDSGDTKWGHIDFPSNGFTSNGTSQVAPAVLESEPSATNSTMFKGEEFQIRVDYRANHYGNTTQNNTVQNYVKLILLDGDSVVDSSLFTTGTAQTSTDIPEWTTSSEITFPIIDESTNAANQTIFQYLYFKLNSTPENEGDIAIQNLRCRIEVWSQGSSASDKLKKMGETVIRGCILKKLYRLISQDFTVGGIDPDPDNEDTTITVLVEESVGTGVFTPNIPPEPIPAWAEVIHPFAVEGYQSAYNVTVALMEQENSIVEAFGSQNLAEEISYIDADGNEQTYLVGQSNGVTSYNQYPGQAVDNETYTQAIESFDGSLITFPPPQEGFTPIILKIDLDSAKLPLSSDAWYLLEVTLKDVEFNEFELPYIQLLDSSNQPQPFFAPGPTKVQIGDYIDQSALKLELIDNKLTGLFKCNPSFSGAENVQKIGLSPFEYDVEGIGISGGLIESVTLTDVSVEATGGSADNWNINPNLYQIERAAIPGTNERPQSHPSVYYQDGQINFGPNFGPTSIATSMIRSFTQQLPDLPEVNDHYELVVEYGNDVTSGTNSSSQFGHEITIEAGDLLDTSSVVVGVPYTYNLNFDGGPAEIKFTADNSFTGSVKSVSLKDMTNYFSASSTGTWIIEGNTTALNTDGEEVIVDNFIEWSDAVNDDGQIFFNGATSGSRIYQEVELPEGQTFQLTFNASVQSIPTAGALKVSYRNESGLEVDSKIIIPESSGFNLLEFTVDEGEGLPQDLPKSIIFEAIGEVPLYADLDNITLRRIITDEEFGVPEQTVSYSEEVKGWVSFKSFLPDNALSLSSAYFTLQDGKLWQHDTNEIRNNFYGVQHNSSITTIMNQEPSAVKSFNTVNYEGTEHWDLSYINTDLDQGVVSEFIKKENKWFNYIKGSPGSFDTSRLYVQGLGVVSHTTED